MARTDSQTEVARSSSSMMMSQSMYSQRNSSERESGAHRATSVHNLDKSVNEEGKKKVNFDPKVVGSNPAGGEFFVKKSQCGNLRFILLHRFYVKSIFRDTDIFRASEL